MSDADNETPGADVRLKEPAATIEAAATDTVAFLGESTTGPTLEPVLVTSWADFAARFGDFSGSVHLAHAVHGFFTNGGVRAFVVNVGGQLEEGLRCLDATPDVCLVVAPGVTAEKLQDAILEHCERRGRFAILDCPDEEPTRPRESTHGACYFPWIEVFDPERGQIHVPPSGHVAGIYARVDAERGVQGAPANEVVRGALGLRRTLAKQEQEALDAQGINCIISARNAIRVWGARTLGSDPVFGDIATRRLALLVERSIQRGIGWAFALPPSRPLWERVTRSISAFLGILHRNGALVGRTTEEAFFVKCQAAKTAVEGPVVVEVGLALRRPGDFAVLRVTGDAARAG